MKSISLSGVKGLTLSTFVDDEDYKKASQYRWYLSAKGYARSSKGVSLHRLIMDCPKDKFIDHINMDKLDNRKSNLRFATNAENHANRGLNKNNSSGYKGVIFDESRRKWRAFIHVGGRSIFLGRFKKKDDAATAYNKAAENYFGNFARFNQL